MDSTKKENPTFAEFMLFGLQGAIGTGANYASSPTREETGQVRCKISDVGGKKLTVIMSPISKSLDSGYSHFHVHQNRAFTNKLLFAPLPLSGQYLPGSVGQPPSALATPAATLQNARMSLLHYHHLLVPLPEKMKKYDHAKMRTQI